MLGIAVSASAVVVIGAVLISSSGGSKSSGGTAAGPAQDATAVNRMLAGIPQEGVALGSASAPVTVREFADLKCPFCRQYTLTTQPTIIDKYVRTNKVRMIFRNLAFVGNSQADTTAAAKAGVAASLQNKLWNFSDVFYHNQGDELTTYVSDQFIRKIGSAVPGLDTGRLLSDRSNARVGELLTTASSEAQQYNVTSTPSFVVQSRNGSPMVVDNYKRLDGAIDKALNR
jgi:protein-disulfide isomerase